MRVLIDGRWVQPKLQGIGRHVLNLLLGLSHVESDQEFLVLCADQFVQKVIARSGGPHRNRFQWVKSSVRDVESTKSFLSHLEMRWILKVNNVHLFHDTGGYGYFFRKIPVIHTIHELESMRNSEKRQNALKRALRFSKNVIAVSQCLAHEVEESLEIPATKIQVIPNAIDPRYLDAAQKDEIRAMRERFQLNDAYFLCVTSGKPSKNSELVIKLASKWTGKQDWVLTLPNEASKPQAGKLKFLDSVEDVWLRPLYRESTAVIVPSFYEGFGLPAIEALASKSIPVVSDIPPHREFLGNILPNNLFFNPKDETSLQKSLEAVISGGAPLKTSILEKFKLVGDRYSFIETAKRVHQIYHI